MHMLGRIAKVLGIVILLGIVSCFGLMGFVYFKEKTLPPRIPSDAIIVLGAQVKEDGTPSVALERRMKAALEEYMERPQMVICCGAQGTNEPEAEGDLMRRWMIQNGVAEKDAVAETDSFNTRQNLINAKQIMDERGLSQALVVTSDYHVARALALCADVGIKATGKGSPSKPEYFIKNHIREGLSWIKYLLERGRK